MKLLPMKMHPFYTEYLWGGELLKKIYHKEDAPRVTAESWELSDNKDGLSYVESGIYQGKTLSDLYKEDSSVFGTSVKGSFFPLLIKLIDANQNLSIQVHPSNESALSENGENGKEEVWYILDCKPDSFIYFGFSKDTNREEVFKKITDGSICEILNKVPVKKGDVFLIKPGTLHAIGAGNLIAEIQQNSNTTFRVFDYNRRGPDGNLRQLHIDRALDVMNYKKSVPYNDSNQRSEFFKVQTFEINSSISLNCKKESFQHLICTSGNLNIGFENSVFGMETGDSYFLPAGMGKYEITGKGTLIISSMPDPN